jgi:hypothetical protein
MDEETGIERRILFYRRDTGEIVSSWTFAREAGLETGSYEAEEDAVKKHLDELERHFGVSVGTLEDEETRRLTKLSHRVDIKTRRLLYEQRDDEFHTP